MNAVHSRQVRIPSDSSVSLFPVNSCYWCVQLIYTLFIYSFKSSFPPPFLLPFLLLWDWILIQCLVFSFIIFILHLECFILCYLENKVCSTGKKIRLENRSSRSQSKHCKWLCKYLFWCFLIETLNSVWTGTLMICSQEKAMATPLVLLPGKSHGRRSLVGCSPWGH